MKEMYLQPEKFTVSYNYINEIIAKGIKKFESKTEFVRRLQESLDGYKFRTLYRNLENWAKREERIPLYLLLVISELVNIPLSEVYSSIRSIRLLGCRSEINVCEFPLKFDKNWAFISECVRVEGMVNRKFAHFTNSDTLLLKTFKEKMVKIGVSKQNFEEKLHVKVEVPFESNKINTQLFKVTQIGKKGISFRFRDVELKNRKRKELIFQDKDFVYGINKYEILNNGNIISVEVEVPCNSKITTKSNYGVGYSAIELRIRNRTLAWILNNIFKIPFGKKSKIIEISEELKSTDKEIMNAIIDAVLSCESCVSVKNKWIRVSLLSKKYLFDFQEVLSKLGISSSISKNNLRICGRLNFKKIGQIGISHSRKERLVNILLNGYRIDQCPKGKSELFYLKSLSELGMASWCQLAKYTGRKGNGSRMYLRDLLQKEFIRIISTSRTKIFKVTNKGKELLKSSDLRYWE